VQSDIEVNLADVRRRIEQAATRAGRNPDDVKLVAVSKTHPSETVREAIAAGVSVFGENKVQEAGDKIAAVTPSSRRLSRERPAPDSTAGRPRDSRRDGGVTVQWHLIGHLQSNKARKAGQLFDVIQSLDSLELAHRLERICVEEGREALSVFVQVDLAAEEAKSGIAESDLPDLIDYLQTCKCLNFDGLMLLPPFFDDDEQVRPYFKRLRQLRDDIESQGSFADGRGELSMGMSNDFEIAIEEGATVVRVGTAIFGERLKLEPVSN